MKTSCVDISWRATENKTSEQTKTTIPTDVKGKVRVPNLFGANSLFNPTIAIRGETITLKQCHAIKFPPTVPQKTLDGVLLMERFRSGKNTVEPVRAEISQGTGLIVTSRFSLDAVVNCATFILHDSSGTNSSPPIEVTILRRRQH